MMSNTFTELSSVTRTGRRTEFSFSYLDKYSGMHSAGKWALSFWNEAKEDVTRYLVSIFTPVASGVHTITMNFHSSNGTSVAPSIFIPTTSRVLGSNVFFRNVK